MRSYTLFYDAECPICVREMARVGQRNVSGSLRLLPVQTSAAQLAAYEISRDEAMTLLHIVDDSDGTVWRGMPALRVMYRECGGGGLAQIWNWPLLRNVADWGYPYFARHRYRLPAWLLRRPACTNGQCRKPPSA